MRSAPAYEALSYAWGNESDPDFQMKLNGCPFTIKRNLRTALQNSRRPDRDTVLWTDALCINQKDTGEKSVQVNMMDRIYSNACLVSCCIGAASKDTDQGLDYANYKAEYLQKTYGAKRKLSREDEKHYYKNYNPSSAECKDREAFLRLFEKTYWSRMWIRQELILSQRCLIRCGESSVLWSKAMLAFRSGQNSSSTKMLDHAYIRSASAYILADAREHIHQVKDSKWLLLELVKSRISAAKDPRDKVFALLGILHARPARDSYRLQADYDQSVLETYLMIFEYCLFSDAETQTVRGPGALNILSASQPNEHTGQRHGNRSEALPSWLPDWAQQYPSLPVWTLTNRNSACANHEPVASISQDGMVLSCEGMVIDRIYKMGFYDKSDIRESGRDYAACYRIYEWMLLAKRYLRNYPGASNWIPFLRTITCDEVENYDHFLDMWERIRDDDLRYGIPDSNHTSDFPKAISRSHRCQRRCFAVSVKHSFMMVPKEARSTDLVCIIFGCDVPVIMRKHRNGRYTFVGDCYVFKYMKGRAMENLEEGLYEVEMFEIE
ncbi:hypothetical protein BP6252_06549 [Coleophoma cylindrospora]|uniref:Heterokaryon incompatibility domain-containing protein n=1 Tax=Coleophoma cylindrospora TaxID=1849047 RepID=A0A3D8RMW6_9HELO|nr:hypothetical protein BP6252_06549 [Coleophoma cylindrospora]